MANQWTESKSNNKALIGAGLAVAGVAAGFLLARRSSDVHDDGANISDAPDHVFRRKTGKYEEGLSGEPAVICGLKNKIQVAATGMMTDATTAKLHRAQAEPGSGDE